MYANMLECKFNCGAGKIVNFDNTVIHFSLSLFENIPRKDSWPCHNVGS